MNYLLSNSNALCQVVPSNLGTCTGYTDILVSHKLTPPKFTAPKLTAPKLTPPKHIPAIAAAGFQRLA